MKKINLFAFLTLACLMTSCGKSAPTYYTVTFIQNNAVSAVVKVKAGETLTDIPDPSKKTGYTVTWDTTDFSNIQENKVVIAVEKANIYTVTYNAEGFAIHGKTVQLTYDSPCSNLDMSLTRYDANLLGWKYQETLFTNQSIWKVADNVTVTAEWKEKTKYTVTFINTDGTYVDKTVYEGQDLTDIPSPKSKTGYTVTWDVTDFTNIRENKVVHAVATAKTYTVNFDPNGGEVSQTTITVTFDQEYSFVEPTHAENHFVSWKYNGVNVAISGVWNIDDESGIVNLVAEWGDSEWTGYY